LGHRHCCRPAGGFNTSRHGGAGEQGPPSPPHRARGPLVPVHSEAGRRHQMGRFVRHRALDPAVLVYTCDYFAHISRFARAAFGTYGEWVSPNLTATGPRPPSPSPRQSRAGEGHPAARGSRGAQRRSGPASLRLSVPAIRAPGTGPCGFPGTWPLPREYRPPPACHPRDRLRGPGPTTSRPSL
jgi:hypothetical protein